MFTPVDSFFVVFHPVVCHKQPGSRRASKQSNPECLAFEDILWNELKVDTPLMDEFSREVEAERHVVPGRGHEKWGRDGGVQGDHRHRVEERLEDTDRRDQNQHDAWEGKQDVHFHRSREGAQNDPKEPPMSNERQRRGIEEPHRHCIVEHPEEIDAMNASRGHK